MRVRCAHSSHEIAEFSATSRVLLSMDAVASGVDLDAMASDLEKAYAPMLKLSFGDIKYGEILPNIDPIKVVRSAKSDSK